MMETITLGIAEDHALVREGFARILNGYPGLQVIFEAGNGKELLKELKEHKPHIVLLDIEMPVVGGISALRSVRQRHPKVKIIIVSAHAEPGSVLEYVKLGAHGFFPKNCGIADLVAAIYAVHEHGTYFETSIAKLLAKNGVSPPGQSPVKKLTVRDLKFIQCLAEEKTAEEIAALMEIKTASVLWYKRKLLLKTNTKDLPALILYAASYKHPGNNM